MLHDAGLVSVEPHGTRRVYPLDPAGAVAVRSYLDTWWDDALDSFEGYVHDHTQEKT